MPSGDALVVVGYDGFVHRFTLDVNNGGECKLERTDYMLAESSEKE